MSLVLSIFPGLDVLGMGFEAEGFCVVRGPDVLWAGDVREFHPPMGVFDGVIGGDPCQSHSTLANLVRAKGLEPRFPDLTPEYQRVVEETRPRWFLRENVPGAPDVKPAGYDVRSFLLDHSTLDRGDGTGHEQMRRRRFWFGVNCQSAIPSCPELRAFIDFALFILPDAALAIGCGGMLREWDGENRKLIEKRRTRADCAGHDGRIASGSVVEAAERKRQATLADSRAVPVKLGGSGKLKATVHPTPVVNTPEAKGRRLPIVTTGPSIAATACDGRRGHRGTRQQAVVGRHEGALRTAATKDRPEVDYSARYSLAEMLELQGLPPDLLEHSPFTMQGKRSLVGNAVPLPMARALARAVRKVMT